MHCHDIALVSAGLIGSAVPALAEPVIYAASRGGDNLLTVDVKTGKTQVFLITRGALCSRRAARA